MKKRAQSGIWFYLNRTIIIAVSLGILVLAFFFFFGSPAEAEENINRQACLVSVEARSTFNIGNIFEPGRDFLPLNCQTEKICISKSGEDCSDAQGFVPKDGNKIKKIKIKNPDETEKEVLDIISKSLHDCHQQLGQGKLNFFPSSWSSKNYCPICARIAFDEEAREDVKDITWIKIYTNMQKEKDGDGISHLKYVYDFDEVIDFFPILGEIAEIKGEDLGELKPDLTNPHGTAIIAQLSPRSNWEAKIGLGGGGFVAATGVAALILAPVTGGATVFGYGILLTGAGGALIAGGTTEIGGTVIGNEDLALASGPILLSRMPDGTSYAHPTLYTYNAEVLSKLECNSFEFLPRAG